MTNLQQNAPILSPRTLQTLWFSVPMAALGVVTLMFAFAVLLPLWQGLQRDSRLLRELEALQGEVSLMRQQLRAQDMQEEKALQQKDKLVRLIAGSGDVSTILAVIDREAKAAGVQLDLVEPQAAAAAKQPEAAAPTPPPAAGQQPAAPNGLEMAGLRPQSLLVSARGSYPQLLAFLRRMEALSVLVTPGNLKLETAAPASSAGTAPAAGATTPPAARGEVTMKISLTLYGQPPQPAAAAVTPGQPGQPGQGAAAGQPQGAPAASP